ncbi:MAG TPA: serine hydrolase domain-containing protein [Gaiellaceae bacterium]|nr:serine hydrolase domain-containing protein [Gaiellaceae bacterium]
MESALAAVDARAREELQRWGVPGLAVGVLAGGETAVRAWGVADLDTGEPVTPATSFRVASVTKPFTAALARATLDLDATLDSPAGPATVRQLLAHVGGLRCEAERPLDGFSSVSEAVARAGLRAWGEPGRLWVYANAGYWLVGAAIEQATDVSFDEAMRTHVLAPLGLAATSFGPPDAAGHEPVAPEALEHRRHPVAGYPPGRRPSGGLVSTVADLLRFAASTLDDDARVVEATRPGGAQGVGWMLERRGDAELVLHPGSVGGFQSVLALVPARRVAVAALSNSARGSAAFGPVVDALLEALADVPPWAPAVVETGEDELAELAGRYAGPDEDARVEAAPGGLRLRLTVRDPLTGAMAEQPPLVGRPVGARAFAVLEGEAAGSCFDFPDRYVRLGSVLAERVP